MATIGDANANRIGGSTRVDSPKMPQTTLGILRTVIFGFNLGNIIRNQ